MDMRSTTELPRVLPHLDDPNEVPVLLPEQRDRPLRLRFVERRLVDSDGVIERQTAVRLGFGFLEDLWGTAVG